MRFSKRQGGAAGGVVTVLIALIVVLLQRGQTPPAHEPAGGVATPGEPVARPHATVESEASARPERLLRAIAEKESEVIVEFEGEVTRVLADDREGDRHQRFIVAVAGDKTVLIAHNIDLAPRVPIEVGDIVLVKGQYEWNDRGGVVHWTHHDPKGWREDGWIMHEGREYR